MAVVSPDDAKLDGICLKDLGPTEIDTGVMGNLSVVFALQLTPEEAESQDLHGATAFDRYGPSSASGNQGPPSSGVVPEEPWWQRKISRI